ncbi:MAG: hypothetical protein ACYC56_05810 [Candidatus Aquicultor sp.]
MLRRFAIALVVVLTIIILSGCQEEQGGRDHLNVADASSTTIKEPAAMDRAKSVEKETLDLENDLDSLSKDIDDFGDFGLDSAASIIDRELDGF